MAADIRLAIDHMSHVEAARREARALASRLGFTRPDAEAVALIVSELATNLLRYAREGSISIETVVHAQNERRGLRIESRDSGPGIADVQRAMQDGYGTGAGLGSGLPAAARLADEFAIQSDPAGTIVTVCKWLPKA